MSGLIALLDDVAAISKVAAASIDDVAGMSVKASAKAAGAVIDCNWSSRQAQRTRKPARPRSAR